MMYHVHYMSAKGGFTTPIESPWVAEMGPFSVLLFFCISGYLIVGSLARHRNVKRFAVNRLLRIYPLFILLHLVMFGIGPFAGYEWMGQLRHDGWAWLGHFFSNLVFLPGLTALPIAQKNAWSLSYEAAFYVLSVAVFIGIRRRQSLVGKLLLALSIIACIESVALESRLLFFGVGVLAWWLDSHKLIAWPSLGPLSFFSCAAALVAYSHEQFWLTALAMLPFFLDVVQQKGWAAPFLSTRPFMWLGQISYSLYLVHPFVLDPLRRLGHNVSHAFGPQAAHVWFVIVGVPLALWVSSMAHDWIEVRLTRRLLRA